MQRSVSRSPKSTPSNTPPASPLRRSTLSISPLRLRRGLYFMANGSSIHYSNSKHRQSSSLLLVGLLMTGVVFGLGVLVLETGHIRQMIEQQQQHQLHLNATASPEAAVRSSQQQVLLRAATTAAKSSAAAASVHMPNPQNPVVHVIETRFMQFQPDLVSLGTARLDLLSTITLPSLQGQTCHDFLWLIRTDPDLHMDIRKPLEQLLRTVPQAVLVASNANPPGLRNGAALQVLNNYDDDSHGEELDGNNNNSSDTRPLTPDDVWVGDMATLEAFTAESQSRIVLHTRLDADDGLERHFCGTLQKNVLSRYTRQQEALREQPELVVDNDTPRHRADIQIWCLANHLEYQHYSVWNHEDPRGALLGMRTNWCVTAGLSWAFAPTYSTSANNNEIIEDVPTVPQHDAIRQKYPDCKKKHRKSNICVDFVYRESIPGALRARTPTSAGMLNLILDAGNVANSKHDGDKNANHTASVSSSTIDRHALAQLQHSKWKHVQDPIFHSLPAIFGISPPTLQHVRSRMEASMVDILQDALQGQCTHGHSCKPKSRQALQTLLRTYQQQQAQAPNGTSVAES